MNVYKSVPDLTRDRSGLDVGFAPGPTWVARSRARRLAALRVQLLEPVEAVAAVPHDLAGPGHVAELLRQLQQPDLHLDDLLVLAHPRLPPSLPPLIAGKDTEDRLAHCQIRSEHFQRSSRDRRAEGSKS